MTWVVIAIFTAVLLAFYMRMKALADRDRREPDAGLAILDFGRAYPDEAIRSIHATLDDKAYFVRLHDGKAGLMVSHGHHFVCHLIEPGKINVSHSPGGLGLQLIFADVPSLDGLYKFKSAEIAAEVGLWLLASFQPRSDFASAGPMPVSTPSTDNLL